MFCPILVDFEHWLIQICMSSCGFEHKHRRTHFHTLTLIYAQSKGGHCTPLPSRPRIVFFFFNHSIGFFLKIFFFPNRLFAMDLLLTFFIANFSSPFTLICQVLRNKCIKAHCISLLASCSWNL